MDGWLVRLIERASRKELFRGESALHEACYSAAPPATVLVIVHHHPEAALIQDKHGRTPLHWALSSKNQFPKARLLLAFLKRQQQQANSGSNSIANAGEAETSWTAQTIQMMLLARNELGYTALDHACSSGAPSDIIESLIQLCPQAATVKRSGRTPLHQLLDFVRANELQVETPSMKILLHAHPTAVSEPDRLGNVPLHLAAYEQTNLDAFEMLLQESKKNRYGNVNVVAMKNRLGSTPLHVAAMNNAPSHVIDQIIEASPATVTAMDVDGNVPLHLAFIYRASVMLKSKLILHGGETLLGIVNDKGQTPIQGAEFVEDVYDILRLMPHVACSCY